MRNAECLLYGSCRCRCLVLKRCGRVDRGDALVVASVVLSRVRAECVAREAFHFRAQGRVELPGGLDVGLQLDAAQVEGTQSTLASRQSVGGALRADASIVAWQYRPQLDADA